MAKGLQVFGKSLSFLMNIGVSGETVLLPSLFSPSNMDPEKLTSDKLLSQFRFKLTIPRFHGEKDSRLFPDIIFQYPVFIRCILHWV